MEIKPIISKNYSSTKEYPEFNNFSTIEDYKNAFDRFKKINGHYPTSIEIDETPYIPSSRTIQRKLKGGVKELRRLMGLEDSEIDQRTGLQRKKQINISNLRSMKSEDSLYKLLVEKLGEVNIHRQEPYGYKIKNLARSDFGIYLNNRHFFIDTFFPTTARSLVGCIGAKLRKYKKYNIQPDVYLHIGNKELDIDIQKIQNRLPEHVKLVDHDKLTSLINNKFVL